MPNVLRSLSHTLAALTANGGAFRAAWERAALDSAAGARWQGEWRSQVNGHHGALRCVLRQVAAAEFEANFHARYARFLRVCYTTRLRATPFGDGWRLEGESDLGGLAGGVYTYRGELGRDRFTCSYHCLYDHGVFDLQPVGKS